MPKAKYFLASFPLIFGTFAPLSYSAHAFSTLLINYRRVGRCFEAKRSESVSASDNCPQPLGPPPILCSLKVGDKINSKRNTTGRAYTIERISDAPCAFVLRNFLSKTECLEVMQKAETSKMRAAETRSDEGSESRQRCDVAWLTSEEVVKDHDNDETAIGGGFGLAAALSEEIRSTLIHGDVASSPGILAEHLQVLRYDEGGMYHIHHDGSPRFLTIIYYLNGIGATWFPFAECDVVDNVTAEELRDRFAKVRQGVPGATMAVRNDLRPGLDGLVVIGRSNLHEDDLSSSNNGGIVPIDQGDVLAFFNYEYIDADDGEPREDWRAMHAGLPADGEKWIANHWFRHIP